MMPPQHFVLPPNGNGMQPNGNSGNRPPTQPNSPTLSDYKLEIRQHPVVARTAIGKEKDRKPVDPPPIIQLRVSMDADPHQFWLQCPYFFMTCCLLDKDGNKKKDVTLSPSLLLGSNSSSLHKLKDTDNTDGGFFVFGDLSIKQEGEYRLKFTLFKLNNETCTCLASIVSDPFTVYPSKTFPGMSESTFLTRSFSDQGVRLRLRKDSRTMSTRKRNNAAAGLSDRMSDRPTRQRMDSHYDDIPEEHHYHHSMPGGPRGPPLNTSMGGMPPSGHDGLQHSPQDLPRHNSFTSNPYAPYGGHRGPSEPRSNHLPPSADFYHSPVSYGSASSQGVYGGMAPLASPAHSINQHPSTMAPLPAMTAAVMPPGTVGMSPSTMYLPSPQTLPPYDVPYGGQHQGGHGPHGA